MLAVPTGTAMSDLSNTPPPGVGPYMITNVVPNVSWVGSINPRYAKEAIPGVPVAKVTIDATVQSNTTIRDRERRANMPTFFDTADSIAPVRWRRSCQRVYGDQLVVQNFIFRQDSRSTPVVRGGQIIDNSGVMQWRGSISGVGPAVIIDERVAHTAD